MIPSAISAKILLRSKSARRLPIETFRSLFGKLLAFVYHCFDRIVIQGYLPLLSREAHVVYFFRDVRGEYPITEKVLQRRTNAYRAWVDSYARNHRIPMEKAKKNVSKEDHVRPYLRRMVAALPASQKAFLLLGVDHSLSATEHPGVQTD